MSKLLRLGVLLSALLFVSNAKAAVSPVGFSLLAPAQLPPTDFAVAGIRLSAIWGRHHDVYGIDLGGVGNVTDHTFTGIAVSGVFNRNYGPTRILGLQAAGLVNMTSEHTRVLGVQIA